MFCESCHRPLESPRVDPENHRLLYGGRHLYLSETETRVMGMIVDAYPAPVGFRDLETGVWAAHDRMSHANARNHVRNIRRKIGAEGFPLAIRTVKNAGYAVEIADG